MSESSVREEIQAEASWLWEREAAQNFLPFSVMLKTDVAGTLRS